MTPKPPVAAKSNGAPQWLIQAGMEGGWIGKDGKAAVSDGKKPAKAPTVTDNGKQYNAAQGLKGVTGGYTVAPNGLHLSDAPPLGGSGQGVKMDHGIRTIGQSKGTQLLAAHPPKFGTHVAKGPSLHYTDDRTGSSPVRAAGPKPKTAPKIGVGLSLKPSGVVSGDRTYKLA